MIHFQMKNEHSKSSFLPEIEVSKVVWFCWSLCEEYRLHKEIFNQSYRVWLSLISSHMKKWQTIFLTENKVGITAK